MVKTYSIKNDKDIQKLLNNGNWFGGDYLSLYVLNNKEDCNYLGIGIGKKIGKAFKRNHIKRLIKESYKNLENTVNYGFNMFFICKTKADFDNITYDNIYNDVRLLLKKAGILN